MKKLLTGLMSAVMAFSCFSMVACNGNSNESDPYAGLMSASESESESYSVATEGKTTISVATYNGGIGKAWLEDAAKRFMAEYEGKSFESGKRGVAVEVKDSHAGTMLTSLKEDVYLTEAVDYFKLVEDGWVADISDVVTGSVGFGETGSIEDKLDGAMQSFLTAKGGKYYGLPFYEGIYGFVYDVDMFEAQGWFFDENGNFTSTNKSVGLDGVAGTYDDGAPRTYAQFKQLVDKIRNDGVTPFTYATESTTYFVNTLANYWADYEGKNKMQVNWSHSGTVDVVSSFNGDVPVTNTATINSTNIKELQKQPGKYYALKFLKDVILSNEANCQSSVTFRDAQYRLISSYLNGSIQTNPVAMVIDGAWFENESDIAGNFNTAKYIDSAWDGGDYKKQRKFAFMPIPMVSESEGEHKQTIVSSNDSLCFVNAGTTGAKLEVAKEFVKFLHTDAELANFTAKTSVTRPFFYSVDDVEESMSYFGKSLMQLKSSSNIVYPYSSAQTYVENSASYMLGAWAWKSKIGGTGVSVENPFNYFRLTENASKTAMDYFQGLYFAH